MMNKLYIGNLSPNVTANSLRELFGDRKLPLSGQVLLKSASTFVDYPDQNWAIRAIETLSGEVELHGKIMEVDDPVSKKAKEQENSDWKHPSSRAVGGVGWTFGSVWDSGECGASQHIETAAVNVTYAAREEAKTAMEKLSGHQFESYSFKISYIPDEEVNSPSPPQRALGALLRPDQFLAADPGPHPVCWCHHRRGGLDHKEHH